jgi:hypothetical protein
VAVESPQELGSHSIGCLSGLSAADVRSDEEVVGSIKDPLRRCLPLAAMTKYLHKENNNKGLVHTVKQSAGGWVESCVVAIESRQKRVFANSCACACSQLCPLGPSGRIWKNESQP